MAYRAYIDLNEMTTDGPTTDGFFEETKAAHAPGILIMLQSLLQMSAPQFKRNAHWMAPMLSELSVCDDRAIRKAVKLVYEKHVNPIVIAACSSASK